MTYEISEEQVTALLAYLLERPYKEVASGIAMLRSLPGLTPEAPAPKEVKKEEKKQEQKQEQKPEVKKNG